jgi:hypothetical protein
MRSKGLVLLAATTICSTLAPLRGEATEPDESMTELELLRAFLEQPAQIEEEKAGEQLILAAGAVAPWSPEPTFEVRHEQNFGSSTAFRTNAIGGSVTLDISGKHGLLRKASQRRAQGVGDDVYLGDWVLACGFRGAVLKAALAEARLDALQHRHDQLSDLVRIVRGLVVAGEVSRHDENRLQLQLATHNFELERAISERRASHAWLERRTGLHFGRIELAALLPPPEIGELREALSKHPGLTALGELEKAAKLDERAVRREAVPKLGIYGAYRMDSGPGLTPGSGFEAGASIGVPWPGMRRPEVMGARAEQAVHKADALQLRDELYSKLEASVHRIQADGEINAVPTPDLDEIWEASWSRYQAGEATVTELVDALISIEQQELSAMKRSFERRNAHLELSCTACVFFEPEIDNLMREPAE